MKANKKKIIVVLVGIFLVSGLITMIVTSGEKSKINEEDEVRLAYGELHRAFGMSLGYGPEFAEFNGTYKPFPAVSESENKFGINPRIYIYVKMYESKTGKTLTYQKVIDYFSQEYEPDGSLRLYNNGLHPEIAEFVIWQQGREEERINYRHTLMGLYGEYYINNKNKGFENRLITGLSPQMLDELVKKEADFDYEMDLFSLQKQGY